MPVAAHASSAPTVERARHVGRHVLLASALAATVSAAHASVVVDTLASSYVQAFLSTPAHENAESFSLGAATALTAFQWAGIYINNTAPTDNFTLKIFGDAGGQPGVNPLVSLATAVTRTAIGTSFGRTLYSYAFSPATGITLGPGTYYFDVVDTVASDAFFWSVTSLTGDFWVRDNPLPAFGPWERRTATMAFRIEGNIVPAPATFPLAIAALAALMAFAPSRRRRAP